MSDRLDHSERVYADLFGPRDTNAVDNDPEFGRILRTYIFGDLFALGELDHRTRELITVTILSQVETLKLGVAAAYCSILVFVVLAILAVMQLVLNSTSKR